LLLFILCAVSVFRFLRTGMVKLNAFVLLRRDLHTSWNAKEKQFIRNFFAGRVPCNVLVFGDGGGYSAIASMNAGGLTVILQDSRLRPTASHARVYGITYATAASEAYRLLRDSREEKKKKKNRDRSQLALRNLPPEVWDTPWDVVVVDGPKGDSPESPGRMASIYTAGLLARKKNSTTTHVVVHDTDRMIEKWFSREFLCEGNLVWSKGRFWDFRIVNPPGS
ncbi:hypothetical protein M569_05147, partial [Genlisea aurea]